MTFNNIANFTQSMYNHAKSGFRQVYPHIFDNRLEICKSCDKLDIENATCKECGCFLMIKAKWASEKCPLDKWGTEEIHIDPISHLHMYPQNIHEDINSMPPSDDCGCNKNNV